MKALLISLAALMLVTPVTADTAVAAPASARLAMTLSELPWSGHPDVDRYEEMPEWASRRDMQLVFIALREAMAIPYITGEPPIRFHRFITAEERAACPDCPTEGNHYVASVNQVWLDDDATQDDVWIPLLKYAQVRVRKLPPHKLNSGFAKNERKFFLPLLQSKYAARYLEENPLPNTEPLP